MVEGNSNSTGNNRQLFPGARKLQMELDRQKAKKEEKHKKEQGMNPSEGADEEDDLLLR